MQDTLRMSIKNAAGLYYKAVLNDNNTYTITTQADPWYLDVLPRGWQETPLKIQRNMSYGGVFRATAESMDFCLKGRAILLHIRYGGGGTNAYALVNVQKYDPQTFSYGLFFEAEVNFASDSFVDDKQTRFLSTPLLQSRAVEMLKAKSNANFNIPFWVYNADDEVWEQNDTEYVRMNQVKLLWHGEWQGGEATATPFAYTVRGWNDGEHGTGSNEGQHTIPYLDNFIRVQNNGATTYVGNDILENYNVMYSQAGRYGEVNFLDGGNVFQNKQYVFRTLLQGQEMNITLSGKFEGNVTVSPSDPNDFILAFVLFEIDKTGEPPQSTPGFYDFYQSLYQITVSGLTPYVPPDSGNFSATSLVTLNPDKAYVLGIIFDGEGFPIPSVGSNEVGFTLSSLHLTIESNYNSGTSTPVTAPALPITYAPSFSPMTLWEKIVAAIPSTQTDIYGFPVPASTFTAASDLLSADNDPADDYGIAPDKLMFTSENALRNINGIQYLTISPGDFFKFYANADGCGLGIEGNTIRIEKMGHFFDAGTEICALTEVSNLRIKPIADEMFNNIKIGYKAPSTNNLFGVDEYIVPAEYATPSNKTPKAEDLTVGSIICGQYETEKMRAQTPLNSVSSPSAANACVVVQRSEDTPSSKTVYDPAGGAHSVIPYYLLTYPTAQSTDPTAATEPYVSGMYYPETARNLGLQPCLNLLRNGPWLRSVFDDMDSEYLTYRRQYQMNYNNPLQPFEQPGINTNIYGTSTNSTGDILIGDLESRLFRPYMFEFEATYAPNIYELLQATPYGYISFPWAGYTFKGFVFDVTQYGGDDRPSTFQLIAHPDTTNDMLKV